METLRHRLLGCDSQEDESPRRQQDGGRENGSPGWTLPLGKTVQWQRQPGTGRHE